MTKKRFLGLGMLGKRRLLILALIGCVALLSGCETIAAVWKGLINPSHEWKETAQARAFYDGFTDILMSDSEGMLIDRFVGLAQRKFPGLVFDTYNGTGAKLTYKKDKQFNVTWTCITATNTNNLYRITSISRIVELVPKEKKD